MHTEGSIQQFAICVGKAVLFLEIRRGSMKTSFPIYFGTVRHFTHAKGVSPVSKAIKTPAFARTMGIHTRSGPVHLTAI